MFQKKGTATKSFMSSNHNLEGGEDLWEENQRLRQELEEARAFKLKVLSYLEILE